MKFRVWFVLLTALASTSALSAYENTLNSLTVPAGLVQGQMELSLYHRFRDNLLDILSNGIFQTGANVRLQARLLAWDRFEALASYTGDAVTTCLGASWNPEISNTPLRFRLEADWYSFQDYAAGNRGNSLFALGALQADGLFDGFFTPTVNACYDLANSRFSAGIALGFRAMDGLTVALEALEPLAVFGSTNATTAIPSLSLSFIADYFGHHFHFTAANSSSIGTRDLAAGARGFDRWYFGFTVQRLIPLYQ